MNDMLASTFELLLAGAAGSLLGLLFFGGLWWTLRRALASPRPALWVGGSLLLRIVAVAAGFMVVAAGDWRRMVSCVLGFWVARWLIIRLTARLTPPAGASRVAVQQGGGEATTGPT
ncbi:MAG: ATP synthase subunit I [Sphingomicrobium sp.]